MKRSLYEYFQTYTHLSTDEKKKRLIYQKIIRRTIQSSYTTGRMRWMVVKYAMIMATLSIIFGLGFLFQSYYTPNSSSGVKQTYADEIANIVSVEGYFEIISLGKRTISPVVKTNDIVTLDKNSSIVMQIGDAFDVVIKGPAKVLVRINPQTKKYRLSLLEGSDISVVSRASLEGSGKIMTGDSSVTLEQGIEIEMRDGSVVSPQSLSSNSVGTNDNFRIISTAHKANIMNQGTSSINVTQKLGSVTKNQSVVVIPSKQEVEVEQTDSLALESFDEETQLILQEVFGDDGLVVYDDRVEIILEDEVPVSGSVAVIIQSGSQSITHVVTSSFVDESVIITDENNDQEDIILPVHVFSSEQIVLFDTWSNADFMQTLTKNLVFSYIRGETGDFDTLHQTLYTQTMKTYSAINTLYPYQEYGWTNTIKALTLLESLLKKTPGINPSVVHNVGTTLARLRRARTQGYQSFPDASDEEIMVRIGFDTENSRFQRKNKE